MAGRTYDLMVRGRSDTKQAQRDLAKMGKASQNLKSTIGVNFGQIAKFGALALGVGLAASVRLGVDELMEAQSVSAQTAAAIKSTGGAAQITAGRIGELASNLSEMSGVDDELIQQGENLLLTFTKIQNGVGKGDKVFDMATKAALDMSVALGEDMTSSAMKVGKALNDPVKGLVALKKSGVQLDATQVKQIKRFVKLGDTMSAQKVILKELNKEFGGSAKAQGETAAGSVNRLKNAYAELSAEILTQAAPSLQGMADKMLEGVEAVRAWTNTADGKAAMDDIRGGIQQLGQVAGSTAGFLMRNRDGVIALGAALGAAGVASKVGAIASAALEYARAVKVAAASQGLMNAAIATNPVGAAAVAVGLLAGGLVYLAREQRENRRESQQFADTILTQVRAMYSLSDAQKAVSGAKLTAKEAALSLTRAEIAFAAVGGATGKKTLAWKEAALGLARARVASKEATHNATLAEFSAQVAAKVTMATARKAQASLKEEARLKASVAKTWAKASKGMSDADIERGEWRKNLSAKELATYTRETSALAKLEKAHKHNKDVLAAAEKTGWTQRNQFNDQGQKKQLRSAKAFAGQMRPTVASATKVKPDSTFGRGIDSVFGGAKTTASRGSADVNAHARKALSDKPSSTWYTTLSGWIAAARAEAKDPINVTITRTTILKTIQQANPFEGSSDARGRGAGGGIDAFGALLGTGATSADVIAFAQLSAGSVFSQNADGSVSVNTAVQRFVQARLRAEKRKLGNLIAKRTALIGTIKARRAALSKAKTKVRAAIRAYHAAKTASAKKKALKDLETARTAVTKIETKLGSDLGTLSYLEGEIMSLGGAIVADQELLEPPEAEDDEPEAADPGGPLGDLQASWEAQDANLRLQDALAGGDGVIDSNASQAGRLQGRYDALKAMLGATTDAAVKSQIVGLMADLMAAINEIRASVPSGGTAQWSTDNSTRSKGRGGKGGKGAAGGGTVHHWHVTASDPMALARRVARILESGQVQLKAGMT